MTGTLNEFLEEDFYGIPRFNLESLRKLSLSEFRERYVNDMEEYVTIHEKPIKCFSCDDDLKLIIQGKDLIRSFGLNLHPSCFLEEYRERREIPYSESLLASNVPLGIFDSISGYGKEFFDLVRESLINAPPRGAKKF